MKKSIIAVALISGLVMTTAASANWGRGGGMGGGMGGGYYCPQIQGGAAGQYSQQLDPAIQEKMDKYYNDTAAMRKELIMKQSQRRALMQGTNPDPAAAAQLAGEIFDLRNSLREKAIADGVDQYVGPAMMGAGRFGRNMGWNGGGGRGGRMMGGPR